MDGYTRIKKVLTTKNIGDILLYDNEVAETISATFFCFDDIINVILSLPYDNEVRERESDSLYLASFSFRNAKTFVRC